MISVGPPQGAQESRPAPCNMGFGMLEIQLLGPMMPNIIYGIEDCPEQTSEYSLGDPKCSLGDQDEVIRTPRSKNLDDSSELFELLGRPG